VSDFDLRLRLKGQAEEDIYFARCERELAEARRRQGLAPGPLRLMSGGETGVDRAALDAALGLGLPVVGWCPAGRRAEDGPIPDRYPLAETPSPDDGERADWNARDSDATLILYRERLAGGSAHAAERARAHGRPLLIRDLRAPIDPAEIARWLHANRVHALHCAGPRESEAPGIYAQAKVLLGQALAAWISAETGGQGSA
jgi:hypothetical protein